jgi:hypothetical protein
LKGKQASFGAFALRDFHTMRHHLFGSECSSSILEICQTNVKFTPTNVSHHSHIFGVFSSCRGEKNIEIIFSLSELKIGKKVAKVSMPILSTNFDVLDPFSRLNPQIVTFGFFGGCDRSPSLVTRKSRQNAKVAISRISLVI